MLQVTHRGRNHLRRRDAGEQADPRGEGRHNGEHDEEECEEGRCRGGEADHEVHNHREEKRLNDGER